MLKGGADTQRGVSRSAVAGALPLIAFGIFLSFSPAVHASEEGEEGRTCWSNDGQEYSIGACLSDRCWWWQGSQRCGQYYNQIQWSECGGC